MDNLKERLLVCFSAVFPERTQQELLSGSVDSVPEWDSLRSITLVALIQEEFQIIIDLLDLEELRSFEVFLARIKEDAPAGGNLDA